jgi:hypothetical protein
VRLLNMNTMNNPFDVWSAIWKLLSDGIVYNRRKALKLPGNHFVLILYFFDMFMYL